MSTETKVEEIFSTNPMQKNYNKQMMIKFINANLLNGGASLDVRKSYVYYDKDKDFVYALNRELADWEIDLLTNSGLAPIKFWSKGIV